MARGGWREAARGKVGPKPKYRPVLPHDIGLIVQMIAWQRYDRPTTDEETAAVLAQIIRDEAQRIEVARRGDPK